MSKEVRQSEFILQTTSNQTLAHRLWRYAQARDSSFYPDGMCKEAVELGPHTDRIGPCLVHCKGSRLTPEQLNAWLYSGPANSTVVRVYWLGAAPTMAASRTELVEQLSVVGPPPDGSGLRLQCFPRSLETWLGDELPPHFNLQPVGPSWVLHVVELPEPPHHLLYSLQPAAGYYNFAAVRDKRVPDQLSKAAGKLAEALAATGLELTRGVAVDLGAAPGKLTAGSGPVWMGGWTHVLAQRARQVIAVDPADMDPRALEPAGVVTHCACKAEEAVDQIRGLVGEAGVDLLVSDVNRHPSQIVDMLRPLLPLLHPGGAIIMTLKFFGRGAGREEEWQLRLADELGPGFVRVQLLWLLANTQHEQTCVAFKKAVEGGTAAQGGGVTVAAAAKQVAPEAATTESATTEPPLAGVVAAATA